MKPVIDFTSYITERTANFTGREWVFRAINNWLANPDGSRFFLLRGEPGSGKTAISASLCQFAEGTVAPPDGLAHLHPDFLSAFHFCSARDSRWINPRVFAESLALQLAKRYPVYAKALAEKSGDRAIRIEVQQQIEQGQGVGVLIKKLDVSGTTQEDAFNRVVREPLEALLREKLEEQVVILVDALDEALYSSQVPNIVSLLSQTDNLSFHVRFILTTRVETRVENEFRNVNELSLSLPSDQRNQDDISRYVKGRLKVDLELAAKAEQVEPTQMLDLAEVVSCKAEGNFLYARFLLDAMAKGLRSLTELDGLPTGLDELYFDSLNRVIKLGKRDWFMEYRPLIGVLSVAQESLTLAQLQAFTAQPESSIWQYLSDLQQFIQEANPPDGQAGQGTRYRLYHQSVIDFLGHQRVSIEQRLSLNNYYIPPGEWHKKLANVCEQGDLSIIWNDIKHNAVEQSRREYARRYYITHLYLAQEWQRLFEILDAVPYGKAKLRSDPSTHSYALDLDLGRQATMWEGWTIDEGMAMLPRLWQYTLLRCSLTSRADRYPEAAFRLLVLLGRKQEALGLAELLTDPIKKVQALVHIALQLREQTSQDSEWLELLMKAGEVSHMIKDSSWYSSGQAEALRDLGTALAQAQQWTEAKRVISTIKDRSAQAEALRDLGTALAQAQQLEQASQVWTEAERVIHTIKGPSGQAWALRALGTALAQAQQMEQASQVWTEAERVISTIKSRSARAEALSALGTALAQAQQMEQASQVWTEAERVIHTIKDRSARAEALSALGAALTQAQQLEQASQVWTEAERVIRTIKDPSAQAEALRDLGTALAQAQQWTEAERVISTIKVSSAQAWALSALGTALTQAQQLEQASQVWTEAERVIRTIGDSFWEQMTQAEALRALGIALTQAQQWTEAERVIRTIKVSSAQAEMYRDQAKMIELRDLAKMMAQTDKLEQLLYLIQHAWQQAKTREEALALFSIASAAIARKPEIGILFIGAFSWVNKFLGG